MIWGNSRSGTSTSRVRTWSNSKLLTSFNIRYHYKNVVFLTQHHSWHMWGKIFVIFTHYNVQYVTVLVLGPRLMFCWHEAGIFITRECEFSSHKKAEVVHDMCEVNFVVSPIITMYNVWCLLVTYITLKWQFVSNCHLAQNVRYATINITYCTLY